MRQGHQRRRTALPCPALHETAGDTGSIEVPHLLPERNEPLIGQHRMIFNQSDGFARSLLLVVIHDRMLAPLGHPHRQGAALVLLGPSWGAHGVEGGDDFVNHAPPSSTCTCHWAERAMMPRARPDPVTEKLATPASRSRVSYDRCSRSAKFTS